MDKTDLADIYPIFSAPPRENPKYADELKFRSCKDETRYKINIYKPTWRFARHAIPLTGEELAFHPELGEKEIWTQALKDAATCSSKSDLLDGLLSHFENEMKIVAREAEPLLKLRFHRLSEIIGIRLRIMNRAIIDYSNLYAEDSLPCEKSQKDKLQQVFQHQFKKMEDLLTSCGTSRLVWPGSYSRANENDDWSKQHIITTHSFKILFDDKKTEYYGNLKLSSDEASTYLPTPLPGFKVDLAQENKKKEIEEIKQIQCQLDSNLNQAVCSVEGLKVALGRLLGSSLSFDALSAFNQAADSTKDQIENLKGLLNCLKTTEDSSGIDFAPPPSTTFDTYCLAVNFAINLYAEGHGPGPGDCRNTNQLPDVTSEQIQSDEDAESDTDPSSSSSAYFTPPPPSSN